MRKYDVFLSVSKPSLPIHFADAKINSMRSEAKISRKEIFYTALFTVFLLAYMIILSVTDDYTGAVSGNTHQYFFHYSPGVTRILGFVSFWLTRRFIRDERKRRLILAAADCIFLASAVLLIASTPQIRFIPVLFTLSFSLGHLGGLVYYCVSAAFSTNGHKGRIIGISCAASILLQFILTEHTNTVTQLSIAAAIFLLVSYLVLKTPADYILDDLLPYAGDSGDFRQNVRRQLAVIISVVFICALLACRTDIAFLSLSFSGSVNIYSYPRLAMIAGYLVMGMVSDMHDRRLINTIFFCGILLSAVLVLMPFVNGSYGFFLSIYYFYISIYVFFYTYSFISVAPRTRAPELWASFGRPLSDLCVAPISFIMLHIGSDTMNASPVYYALFYLILLIMLYIIMTNIQINPNLTSESERSGDSALLSVEKWLDRYPLTPREKDVAYLLISTDDPIKAVACSLNISERSVYRYAASIYEKTGIDNRTGLVKQYMSGESGYER